MENAPRTKKTNRRRKVERKARGKVRRGLQTSPAVTEMYSGPLDDQPWAIKPLAK